MDALADVSLSVRPSVSEIEFDIKSAEKHRPTCARMEITLSPWVPTKACDALLYKSVLYDNICN